MKTIAATVLALSLMTANAFADDSKPAPMPRGELRDVATCKDGKTYRNDTGRHQGACAGHGGVASWADGSAVKSHERHSEYR